MLARAFHQPFVFFQHLPQPVVRDCFRVVVINPGHGFGGAQRPDELWAQRRRQGLLSPEQLTNVDRSTKLQAFAIEEGKPMHQGTAQGS